jgi:hypothetical protein
LRWAAAAGDPFPSASGRPATPTPGDRSAGGAVPTARRDHEADQPHHPDAAGRGWRAHHQLQNQLVELVRAAGWSPRDPAPIDPEFDLAWETSQGIGVVEVKSCTKENEVRQLRMGIGQVLDYDDSLRARGRAVLPVLYLERGPSDTRWVALAERHHVRLVWPGTEDVLFQERSPAAATTGN